MKLIEKLAWDFKSDEILAQEEYPTSIAEAYMAGFRKAREVAAQICEDVMKHAPRISETDWVKNAEGVRKIGEEEV